MNVGNVTTSMPTEGKNQNSVFGKFEYSADKQQLNANENLNSGNGISLGESVFKNLLLNSKSLNNGVSNGNPFKTATLEEEPSTEEETKVLVGNDINPQGISPLDIKILMSSGSLNSNALKLKQDIAFSNIEQVQNVEVDKLVGNKEAVKVDENKVAVKVDENKVAVKLDENKVAVKLDENKKVVKLDENQKAEFSNSTFMKISKEDLNQTNSSAVKDENKELNQEKQATLKESDLRGIERAAFSNNKEINPEKLEKLASIKEKNDEKSTGIENGEIISSINKPGNLVNDPIEVNLKNQKLENVPVYNQIAEEIAAKLEQKGPMEFKLQLKPENLGEIDISIKISDGKLSIDILSANSKTQDLLVSQVDRLITKLGLQNFQIENVQVNPNNISVSQDTTSQDTTSLLSLTNLSMNFSDRRQQETLKEQNNLRKGSRAISSMNGNEKGTNNDQGMSAGKNYSGYKINYSF